MIQSAEEFIRLRTSNDPIEYERAAYEEAPLEVWHDIIVHHPEMRQWVAHNKTVPLEILAILARDSSLEVRLFVAMKNKLSPDLMLLLVDDENESVRERIAYNNKATKEALRILASDKIERIAERAQRRLAAGDFPGT